MIQKLKNAAVSLTALATLLVPSLALATPAFAATSDIQDSLCSGTNLDLSGAKDQCGTGSGATSNLNSLLKDIVNIFSAIVGVVAVIMIIVGGLRYITSGGDSGKVGTAKNTLIYAIIGLVVVALAQVIVHFVFAKATSV
jgi:cytochrome bd-type quinol oxidase subunit 2